MRYLVYTAVTGKYDKVNKILGSQDPNIDFVCYTDQVTKDVDLKSQTGWIFKPLPKDLHKYDNRRKARLIKIQINNYAPGYDGYLWIDAPIVIIGNMLEFFNKHPFDENHGIYVSKHYMRDCLYQEFAQVVRLKKDLHRLVYDQYQKYKNMNYPANNGMAETSILYRNFKDLKVQVHATTWAQEIKEYSYRDQLSFNWSAWYTKTPITYLNEHIYIKDTENETSEYFFLPWPKHNNNRIYQQLQECLDKRKQNQSINKKANVENIQQSLNTLQPNNQTNSQQLDQFEREYQEFIEKLKKKQAEKKEKKNDLVTKEIDQNFIDNKQKKISDKPKRKRNKRKQIKT